MKPEMTAPFARLLALASVVALPLLTTACDFSVHGVGSTPSLSSSDLANPSGSVGTALVLDDSPHAATGGGGGGGLWGDKGYADVCAGLPPAQEKECRARLDNGPGPIRFTLMAPSN
ncbi:hypothetical protein PPSIR1_08586 [Plesiocystis pacifica SIR-1]|uniref:Lipoprotein n=1 Tax=Plesiocystis pacifica SIR-1 TaxID=391625 RepID=A6G794_9BACT|nr:hypothetical protein [Plesiocystis pacifica]EDM78228.1 hypothetical protein PPSIR1_08586 [Plesiocystis pacifica SIR-1]